ncbi:ferritin-like domain-containing protein [Dactylosporangium sp. AC04546]|uniref:ferritin-like domain-containing protein n=1 Tax=Dactylosporangium sp. AC04546 TaxID=2862460 RepID=UPI001EDD5945|nr:ferritin-like domain-containing protein [Dactylosporangium sp. AC04546]WVK85300.1 ferritin-like domain-containing protein [Dactylosporangium sp. AC04546]
MTTPADERLIAALQAEHAAIYGFGIAGPKLDSGTIGLARTAETAHRNRRDALVVRLSGAGVTAPAAAPAYQMPFPVTDRASALKLAVLIEERTAAQWRLALPVTAGEVRKLSLDALVDCATRAVAFRQAAGTTPVSVPFPGKV